MPFSTHRVRTSALILLSALPFAGLSACASPAPIFLNAGQCSSLIPGSWRSGVPAPSLPTDDTVGGLAVFADAAIGQLDKANGRTADTIAIVEACERRDAAAAERLSAPWYRRLMPG